jgi:hypothetical protein
MIAMKRNKQVGLFSALLSFLSPFFLLASPAQALSWVQVTEWFNREVEDRGRGANGGSRPVDGLCLLSPGHEQRVWSLSPTFVWQGMATVGVRPAQGEAILWQAEADETVAGAFREQYDGPDLERGQEYHWLFFITPDQPTEWFNFRVVDRFTHWRIARDLEALQAQLKAEGAGGDAIALARAHYFLEKDLLADAIQAMFTVSEPSEELVEAREALVEEICS